MHPLLRITALTALWLVVSAAVAATVYRWVDDQGKVHYSDVVPERYRSTAKLVNTPAAQPAAEHHEALERAQREKTRASAPATNRSSQAASTPPDPAASKPPSKRPIQIPNDQTDCETWQRLYMESIECFGPYRTVRGATKPEAFDVCNVVPEPPSRCRMRIP